MDGVCLGDYTVPYGDYFVDLHWNFLCLLARSPGSLC